ncbi:MAG: hypothetical protein GY832_08260 [Chloroflexi bacterium]|nr:hypothetical protein [Chloroflexota bacterium]
MYGPGLGLRGTASKRNRTKREESDHSVCTCSRSYRPDRDALGGIAYTRILSSHGPGHASRHNDYTRILSSCGPGHASRHTNCTCIRSKHVLGICRTDRTCSLGERASQGDGRHTSGGFQGRMGSAQRYA